MSEPVLNLETVGAEVKTVRIDGEDYRLATMNDLNIRQLRDIQAVGRTFQLFTQDGGMEELTDEEVGRIEAALSNAVCLSLPDLPEEVEAKLTDGMRLQVTQAFLQVSGLRTDAATPGANGAISSPRSSASTAAHRRNG